MLPIPNAEEVERFKELYLREFGVELTGEQALEVSMSLCSFSTSRTIR